MGNFESNALYTNHYITKDVKARFEWSPVKGSTRVGSNLDTGEIRKQWQTLKHTIVQCK